MSRASPGAEPDTAWERTALAWNRSGLATLGAIAVLLRHLWPLHGVGQEVALAVVSLVAIIWAVAQLLASERGRGRQPTVINERGGLLLCVGTVLLAAVGFGLAFLTPA